MPEQRAGTDAGAGALDATRGDGRRLSPGGGGQEGVCNAQLVPQVSAQTFQKGKEEEREFFGRQPDRETER